jgi:hypothetical protein
MSARDGDSLAAENVVSERSGDTEKRKRSEFGDIWESGEILSFCAAGFTESYVPDAE